MRGKLDSVAQNGGGVRTLRVPCRHLAKPLAEHNAYDQQRCRFHIATHKQYERIESFKPQPLQQTQRNHTGQMQQQPLVGQ